MEGPTQALTLLHTADIHSRVWPFRSRISRFEAELGLGEPLALTEVGGVARLATLLEAERRRGEVLWLDSGDALEGAEVFHRFGGQVELELLSALGLGAMTLGNHELSLGGAELARLLADFADFAVLSANLRPRADSALAGLLQPSALLEVGGVRVGVVGVANPSSPPNLASPDNPWGLELAADLAAAVQAEVDAIAAQAALIVVLSHLGLEADQALVRGTTGIDLVLGGHQHLLTAEPQWQDDCNTAALEARRGCSPRRVPIVHSGAYARWLSRLELTLAPDPAEPNALELSELTLTHLPLTAQVAAQPQVAEALEARRPPPEAPLAFLPAPLTRRSALAGDSALGNLAVDAVRLGTSADVVLLNSSGLRADLEGGPLLRADLALAFPFDEPWRLVWLEGSELRAGLVRAAVRSAARACEASLQVAGLRLRVHCAACASRSADCLEIARPGLHADATLAEDEWLLVALPTYLTLPGGDFDVVGGAGSDVAASPLQLIAERFETLPSLRDTELCARALAAWTETRCREGFGALACPLTPTRARATCATLPVAEGGRDGRIVMLP